MAIGLQAALPAGYAPSPRWLIPALETAVAIVVFIGDTAGTSRFDRPLRRLSLAVIGLLTTANAVAGVSLVNDGPVTILLDADVKGFL